MSTTSSSSSGNTKVFNYRLPEELVDIVERASTVLCAGRHTRFIRRSLLELLSNENYLDPYIDKPKIPLPTRDLFDDADDKRLEECAEVAERYIDSMIEKTRRKRRSCLAQLVDYLEFLVETSVDADIDPFKLQSVSRLNTLSRSLRLNEVQEDALLRCIDEKKRPKRELINDAILLKARAASMLKGLEPSIKYWPRLEMTGTDLSEPLCAVLNAAHTLRLDFDRTGLAGLRLEQSLRKLAKVMSYNTSDHVVV